MSYPLRENLEVITDGRGNWIRCARCDHMLCPAEEDWKNACRKRTFPPTKAGPLMGNLTGRYVFQKLYCPSCGVLLDADMEEVQ